jgi:purine-binding chemotaxis protein CheW
MVAQVPAAKPLRVVKCALGNETFALDMAGIQGIERADLLRSGSDEDGPLGYLPGPGRGTEVISLARRFGRQSRLVGAHQQVIVHDGPLGPWGLLVDHVSQVMAVARDQVDLLPPVVTRLTAKFFQAVVHIGQEMILLLDPEALNPQLPAVDDARFGGQDGKLLAARYSRAFDHLRGYWRGSSEIVLFATTEPQPRARPVSFGLSKSQVLEIVEAPSVLPVPAAPPFLRGLVNWRNLPVPVLDLGQQLGLPGAVTDKRTRLMVVHGCDPMAVVAFPVRPFIRVMPLPIDHVPCRQTLSLDSTLTRGVFELKGETMIVPDVRRLCGIH